MTEMDQHPTTSINVDAEFDGIIRANYDQASLDALYESILPPAVENDAPYIDGESKAENDRRIAELKREQKGSLFSKLGAYAMVGQLSLQEKAEQAAARTDTERQTDVNNSRFKKFGKAILRGSKENWRTILPAATLATMAGYVGLQLFAMRHGAELPHPTASPEVRDAVMTTDILAGGRSDGQGDFIRSAWPADGHNVVTANYPANIFPADPGRMDVSSNIGANSIYDHYLDAKNTGNNVRIVGYSEGTSPAVEAANRIAAENGGKLPDNVQLILFAPPYGPGGFFSSDIVHAANPVLGAMGIPTGETVPAGAHIITYDSDLWGNGGAGVDGQPATTTMRQLLEVGLGGHDPAINPPAGSRAVTFVQDGVTKTVVTRRHDVIVQDLMDRGVYIADPDSFDRMADDFAPINILPTDNKQPNFNAAMWDGATAVDHQIDPSGNTRVVRDIVNQMPPEMRQAGQSGIHAMDTITDTAAKIGDGRIDPITGTQTIMNEVNKFMGDFQRILPPVNGNGNSPIHDWIENSADNITHDYGINVDQQIHQIVHPPQQPARGASEVHTQTGVNLTPIPQPTVPPVGSANIDANVGVPVTTLPPAANLLPPPANIPLPAGTPPIVNNLLQTGMNLFGQFANAGRR